jgi:hypothetical protein
VLAGVALARPVYGSPTIFSPSAGISDIAVAKLVCDFVEVAGGTWILFAAAAA